MEPNRARPPRLIPPIADFFAHETSDSEAVARCFTEDGVVLDEGHEYHGRAAIAAWNARVVATYKLTTEPIAAETAGTRTTVTARIDGDFPGSPLQLRFQFSVSDDLIRRLEIAP